MLSTFLRVIDPSRDNGFCWEGKDYLCTKCDVDNQRCAFCAYGYLNEETGQCVKPKKCISNCLSYASETECKDCNFGTQLNEDGICAQFSKSQFPCASADSKGACSSCFNVAIENKTCKTYKCSDPRCMVCSENGCLQCQMGHTMINLGTCAPWSSYPNWQHCYNTDGTKNCVDCDAGYYNDNGVCKRNLKDNKCEAWNINNPLFEDYVN